jgi:hypothetical protein
MCQLWRHLGANFVELRACEVRGIYLLSTTLTKGEKQAGWRTASVLLPFGSGNQVR